MGSPSGQRTLEIVLLVLSSWHWLGIQDYKEREDDDLRSGDEVQEEELGVGKLRKSVHRDIDHGPRVLHVFVQNSHGQCLAERLCGLLGGSDNVLEMVCSLHQIFDILQAQQILC